MIVDVSICHAWLRRSLRVSGKLVKNALLLGAERSVEASKVS
jgi:hypothetical protein